MTILAHPWPGALERARDAMDALTLEDVNARAGLLERQDVKYLLNEQQAVQLLHRLVDSHEVLEIDGRRAFGYDSTYFDTETRQLYRDHALGPAVAVEGPDPPILRRATVLPGDQAQRRPRVHRQAPRAVPGPRARLGRPRAGPLRRRRAAGALRVRHRPAPGGEPVGALRTHDALLLDAVVDDLDDALEPRLVSERRAEDV